MLEYFLFLVNQNVGKTTKVYGPLSRTLLKFVVCPCVMGCRRDKKENSMMAHVYLSRLDAYVKKAQKVDKSYLEEKHAKVKRFGSQSNLHTKPGLTIYQLSAFGQVPNHFESMFSHL